MLKIKQYSSIRVGFSACMINGETAIHLALDNGRMTESFIAQATRLGIYLRKNLRRSEQSRSVQQTLRKPKPSKINSGIGRVWSLSESSCASVGAHVRFAQLKSSAHNDFRRYLVAQSLEGPRE